MIHGNLTRAGKHRIDRELEFKPSLAEDQPDGPYLWAATKVPAAGGGETEIHVDLYPSKDLITHLADLDPIAFLDACPDLIHRAVVALAERLTEADAATADAKARIARMEAALRPEKEAADEAAV